MLNKNRSAIFFLFIGPEVLLGASDKGNIFVEIVFENLDLADSCISFPAFSSRINLTLDNILVIPSW